MSVIPIISQQELYYPRRPPLFHGLPHPAKHETSCHRNPKRIQ
uniref:Uncharacterized protein n=1 Tax=Arundo donax TaxID=35708 RepID=A0A0A9HQ96_ARUDO